MNHAGLRQRKEKQRKFQNHVKGIQLNMKANDYEVIKSNDSRKAETSWVKENASKC